MRISVKGGMGRMAHLPCSRANSSSCRLPDHPHEGNACFASPCQDTLRTHDGHASGGEGECMTCFRVGIDCSSNPGNASVFTAPESATTLPVELTGAGVEWVAL